MKEGVKSTILLSACNERITLMHDEKIHIYTLDSSKPKIASIENILEDSIGCCAVIWGRVVSVMQKKVPHTYQLVEFGPLDFALRFCVAMDNFYKAISYIPPNSQRVQDMTLDECVSRFRCAQTF